MENKVVAFQLPRLPANSKYCCKYDISAKSIAEGRVHEVESGFINVSNSMKAFAGMTSAMLLSAVLLLPNTAWSLDVSKGETLFQANCAGCHAGGNNFVSQKRTLQKEAIQQYRGSTDQDVIKGFVQNGMPHKILPMKTPMEENDYSDVVAYVLDQALGDKW
jgi:cytochrome c6